MHTDHNKVPYNINSRTNMTNYTKDVFLQTNTPIADNCPTDTPTTPLLSGK